MSPRSWSVLPLGAMSVSLALQQQGPDIPGLRAGPGSGLGVVVVVGEANQIKGMSVGEVALQLVCCVMT